MDEEQLQRLFEAAIELPRDEQADFILRASGDDVALRQELESLLVADQAAVDETIWQRSALLHRFDTTIEISSAIGSAVGNYRLVELIGRGGMGAVYRAERTDDAFEKYVAVKLIDAPFCSSEMIAHFRAERQILASLEHANIARLLDGGTTKDGLPFLVMEYVDGMSPYDYCARHNLSIQQRLVLFRQICSAVHFAHQNMVIHRDLKPANILIKADGTAKLLDFGIAKVLNLDSPRNPDTMTAPGMLRLTVRYASPEQILGHTVTTASDVYSLGVLLHELLSGHSPYGDVERASHRLMHAVCEEDAARPSIWNRALKGDLDNIVLMALRKSPLERYASADEFSQDISRYLENRPVAVRARSPLYVASRFVRRNRVTVAFAALLLCSLIAGLFEVMKARDRADRRFNEVRQLAHSVMFDYADAIDTLPGATPVRARLVSDALHYLDNLSRDADTPELQREIVDAYVRVSNVQGNEYENNIGNTAAAMVSARKAMDAAGRLLKATPELPSLVAAANAFSTYGSLSYSIGDLQTAARAYLQALDLYEQVQQRDPHNFENRIALSICFRHLGDVYGGYGFKNLGQTRQSLAYYGRGKSTVAALTEEDPDDIDVAKESYKTLLSFSSSEIASGDRKQAGEDLDHALSQIEKVYRKDPKDTNVRVELAIAESRSGQLLLDKRAFPQASSSFAQSDDVLQKLLREDPSNVVYRRGLSVVESQLSSAMRGEGRREDAVAHGEIALTLAKSLSADAPQSAQYRSDVGNNERKLSEALLANGRSAAGLRHAQEARAIFCPDKNGKGDTNTLANCARAMLAEGNAYNTLKDPHAASVIFSEAEKIAELNTQSDSSNSLFSSDLARLKAAHADALLKSGDYEAAENMYQASLKIRFALQKSNRATEEDLYQLRIAAHALSGLEQLQKTRITAHR